jgi:hypothetical protein
LLQARQASVVAGADEQVRAENAKQPSSTFDDGDDWLGLGDVLSPPQQLRAPHHSANCSSDSAVIGAKTASHAADDAQAAHDGDEDDLDASLVIQREVEAWIKGIPSFESLSLMVR